MSFGKHFWLRPKLYKHVFVHEEVLRMKTTLSDMMMMINRVKTIKKIVKRQQNK